MKGRGEQKLIAGNASLSYWTHIEPGNWQLILHVCKNQLQHLGNAYN